MDGDAIKRSTSGAVIVQFGDTVLKLGDTPKICRRLDAQAEWLQRYASEGIMDVRYTIPNVGYAMPRATEWDDGSDARVIFDTVVMLLEKYVWKTRAEQSTDSGHKITMCALRRRGNLDPERFVKLIDAIMDVQWGMSRFVVAHGDPTFCNMMYLSESAVLTDPLPAYEVQLPNIRAIDLGKLLQSCMGFETIVYGWKYAGTLPSPYWVQEVCDDQNEWNAAIACGLLHIVRLLPYVGEQFHEEFMRVFDEMLCLRSGWDTSRL